jgi:hypothetical protein
MWCGECGAAGAGNAGVMKHTFHPPLVPVLAADACLDSFDRLAGWRWAHASWRDGLPPQFKFSSIQLHVCGLCFPGVGASGSTPRRRRLQRQSTRRCASWRRAAASSGGIWTVPSSGATLPAGGIVSGWGPVVMWLYMCGGRSSPACCPACVCLGLDLLLLLLTLALSAPADGAMQPGGCAATCQLGKDVWLHLNRATEPPGRRQRCQAVRPHLH